MLDVLIDHLAAGHADLDDASRAAALSPKLENLIQVFPAGRIDDSYLSKLARLDFASSEPGGDNPVSIALDAMLKKMKSEFDVILLDARAGLHDLAGLSLHGLAHVDVLAFRGTEQNLAGLAQTLRTLSARKPDLVLVETLLPPSDEEVFKLRHERTRDRVYDLLLETRYRDDDPPQRDDRGEPHDVLPVRRKEWLDAMDAIAPRIDDVLRDEDLRRIARRIDVRCGLCSVTADEEGVAS